MKIITKFHTITARQLTTDTVELSASSFAELGDVVNQLELYGSDLGAERPTLDDITKKGRKYLLVTTTANLALWLQSEVLNFLG